MRKKNYIQSPNNDAVWDSETYPDGMFPSTIPEKGQFPEPDMDIPFPDSSSPVPDSESPSGGGGAGEVILTVAVVVAQLAIIATKMYYESMKNRGKTSVELNCICSSEIWICQEFLCNNPNRVLLLAIWGIYIHVIFCYTLMICPSIAN